MGSRKKKGYSIGLCVVFNEWGARVYQLLSNKIKNISNVSLGKKYNNFDQKELYKFHESIINAIRPFIREENKAIVVVAPKKTKYWEAFSSHLKKGHRWLDSVAFELFDAEISNDDQMRELYQTEAFKIAIGQARAEESDNLENDINKYMNKLTESSNLLYGINEIETWFLENRSKDQKIDAILLMSEEFLEKNHGAPKVQRIRQLAKNRGVAEKIFEHDSGMNIRLKELGGIVLFKDI